jgi:hypothetical protein
MGLMVLALGASAPACLNTYTQDGETSNPEEASCSNVSKELEAERQRLQACESDNDCGASEGKGSCGCTRALAIRADADPTRYRALVDRAIACGLPAGGGSCDCPKADGFRCEKASCAWNYVSP